ncbi:aminoacyl-tRNA deacylase [Kribbia dieselivorans]|uniref:aminoacyl-tRNA deacylase n=1 Tax=Kribbia dieselivorans TaxID=331526 RepID=UPI00083971BC|nr:YbaK/EbsC family protein [Kribbia dieselivorans]
MSEERATAALATSGLDYTITRHGRVASLAEAAERRGVEPRDIVKTLVVRRSDDDYLFVLVPGDRQISWPKLRSLLGVSRLSMPDAAVAKDATGYERGTITPFGSTTAWPVLADASLHGDPERRISLGAGAHGVAVTVQAEAAIAYLGAQVADVTDLMDGEATPG